ncbi:dipeptide ABC transporter ATP-binding protein [Streptomyces sp. NPDC050982]|uniref:dipeptide ABC transporter ATP-binding protein n=1 Tax=Streptomyces sp. NPDC050982 TaxID=3154746 RepID=UPI0033DC8137
MRMATGTSGVGGTGGILEVEDLGVTFSTETGDVPAVRGVSLCVRPGETLALVGESGSGKSTVALAAMGLLPGNARASGRASVDGTDVVGAAETDLVGLRGRTVSMVFQEPATALDPLTRIGAQIAEVVRNHRPVSAREAAAEAVGLLRRVGIPDPEKRASAYPFQLSGGQRQRVVIAMAIANSPSLLIADEPTTALDVTVQAEILDLLRGLAADSGTGVLLVTHNMGVVADFADRVAVMLDGEIVETGPVEEVLLRPTHAYTQRLLAAVPRLTVAEVADANVPGPPGGSANGGAAPSGAAVGRGAVGGTAGGDTAHSGTAPDTVAVGDTADGTAGGKAAPAETAGGSAAPGTAAVSEAAGGGAAPQPASAEPGIGAAREAAAAGRGSEAEPPLADARGATAVGDGAAGAKAVSSGAMPRPAHAQPAVPQLTVPQPAARPAVTRPMAPASAHRTPETDADPDTPAGTPAHAPVVELRGVSVRFGRGVRAVQALRDVSLTVRPGETLGLVGESGSGKSTAARVALGLVAPSAGSVSLFGADLRRARGRARRALLSGVGVVLQDPVASLDARMSVAECVAEPLRVHRRGMPAAERRERVAEVLERVRLPRELAGRGPRELSGGQRQRVSLARALVLDPRLLVADEPTSALDVSVQQTVLDVIAELQDELGFACLFVSHDLAVVQQFARRVVVMRAGRVEEEGATATTLTHPETDYTRRLIAAVPVPDPVLQRVRRTERQAALAAAGTEGGA